MVALVTAITTTQFAEVYPLYQRIILGLIVSVCFLVATTVRELILSVTTFPREISTRQITIFIFGGVTREIRDSHTPPHQPLLYLARFLSNLLIAAVFYGLYATFINTNNLMMAGVFQWLAYIYFLIFLLHFVPAFPLDGGKILRTFLWRSKGDYYKATRIASFIGLATGLSLIFAGVLVFIITRMWIVSLLIVYTGWTIQIAAGNTRRQVITDIALQSIKAEDIMTGEYPVMPRQTNLGQLIRDNILVKGWPYIVVAEGTKLEGILTLEQIKSVPWKRWNNTTIGDIMTPSDKIRTAYLQQPADILFEEMYQANISYIPVTKDDDIVGIVNRNRLTRLARIRDGFGA
jgi:predicted transcriptional regulator